MKLRRTYAPWLQKGEIYAYPDLNFMLHLSDAIYAFDVLLEPCIKKKKKRCTFGAMYNYLSFIKCWFAM